MFRNRFAFRLSLTVGLIAALWSATVPAARPDRQRRSMADAAPQLCCPRPAARSARPSRSTFAGTEVEEPTGADLQPSRHQGDADRSRRCRSPIRRRSPTRRRSRSAPPITKFTVTIGKDVPVGFYDVRLVNKNGVSNPRRFVVGDLDRSRREGAEQRRRASPEGRDRHHHQRHHRGGRPTSIISASPARRGSASSSAA